MTEAHLLMIEQSIRRNWTRDRSQYTTQHGPAQEKNKNQKTFLSTFISGKAEAADEFAGLWGNKITWPPFFVFSEQKETMMEGVAACSVS